ncbi:outer membrane lopoprotein PlpP [Pasteurella canis]|uniref:Outer membrane lopoprotein PlpP n=1 Tax=Pasteurella canis TaxID=753 RepID=A0A379EWI1_9PAST|nr:hypothetical protein [Pasteurella canis]SUC10747.1 outer membrane lopoprotein PlpP [Pasteurella canis]
MKKAILKLSLISLSALLVACGGGGGGGSSGNDAKQPPQPIQPEPPAPNNPNDNGPKLDDPKQPQPPKKDVEPPKPAPEANLNWHTGCTASSNSSCNEEGNKNSVKVYKLTTTEDPHHSETDITTETVSSITLQNGINNGDGYSFTLLDENQGDMYYGYRQRANVNRDGSHYELVYAVNNDYVATLPNNYTATYKQDGGFIYTPYVLSSSAQNIIIKKGNVEIYYKDGNVNGEVYDTIDKTHPIFNITGKNTQLTIESTKNISISGTPISENQKASMEVKFINSKKGTNDYKYIIGTGKSHPGANKEVGFSALLFAEKEK